MTEHEEKFRDVHTSLVDMYGKPDESGETDGVEQLVATILSQNVADTNTERAMSNLLDEFYSFKQVEESSVNNLAEVIRPAGLPQTKAERIQNALRMVRQETDGEYTLAFLDEYSTEDARDWLQQIHGVGPKTANVVLSFHFEKPAMPVDTHVERVSSRFGMIPDGTSNQKAHELMNNRSPDEIKYDLHMLLIEHGREYCSAQNADCDNPVCDKFCNCKYCDS